MTDRKFIIPLVKNSIQRSITGLTSTILIIGAALGPMPLGIARDWLGNYNAVLTLCALIPFGLGLASLIIGRPGAKSTTEGTP